MVDYADDYRGPPEVLTACEYGAAPWDCGCEDCRASLDAQRHHGWAYAREPSIGGISWLWGDGGGAVWYVPERGCPRLYRPSEMPAHLHHIRAGHPGLPAEYSHPQPPRAVPPMPEDF